MRFFSSYFRIRFLRAFFSSYLRARFFLALFTRALLLRVPYLKLAKSSKIETLNCANNKLKNLDVSGTANLKYLDCSDNNMGGDPDISVTGWNKFFSKALNGKDATGTARQAFIYYPQNGAEQPASAQDSASPNSGLQPVLDASMLIDGNKTTFAKTLSNSTAGIFISGDEYYMPAQSYLENVGAFVKWDAASKKLTAKIYGKQYIFTANDKNVSANGKTSKLKAEPLINDGILYIPASSAELFGDRAKWNAGKNQLEITSNSKYDSKIIWYLNSLNANANIRNSFAFDIAGGIGRSTENARTFRNDMNLLWGVTDRDDAIVTIMLLYLGMHNNAYYVVYDDCGPWGELGIIAWDYCRISQVAGNAYIAGYISLDEFVEFVLPAAQLLQLYFDGWVDMDANFVEGAAFWQHSDVDNPNYALRQRMNAHEELKKIYKTKCPDWNTNIDIEIDNSIWDDLFGSADADSASAGGLTSASGGAGRSA